VKTLFNQNEIDPYANEIILIGQVLLLVTLSLLTCSYLYYQFIGRYSETRYCFNNECFDLTSSVHIKHEAIQEPPYIPPVFDMSANQVHIRQQESLMRQCNNDAKCIQEVKMNTLHQIQQILGTNVKPFIPVVHDARTKSFLHRTEKRWLKKANVAIYKKLKTSSALKYRKMTLKLTDQGFPIICGEISDDLNTFINYQSFVYLGETDRVILLETDSQNRQPFSNKWQEHCF